MAMRQPLDRQRELLEAFDDSGRVSEYLTSVLPRRLWHAEPPTGYGRSIAAIVAHMQSVRRTFERRWAARSLCLRHWIAPAQRRPTGVGRCRKAVRRWLGYSEDLLAAARQESRAYRAAQ
jgi:hypothetical protein